MDGSVPDLRWQVAALLAGTIDLNQFQHWFIANETAIEQCGSDDDVDFLDDVMLLLAEYTGDHISASQLMEALRKLAAVYDPDLERAAVAMR